MKSIAIIQARMSSTRLPGKTLIDLAGKPMLLNIIERVSRAKRIDNVIVATSNQESDDLIELFLKRHHLNCFRGDLDNVLKRFYECAKEYDPKIVVRLTADNALIDPTIIDESIDTFTRETADYLYYKPSLPLGMCIEVFTFAALEKAYYEAIDKECLEHVTPYIRKNPKLFRILNYADSDETNHSNLRFTMDTKEDYEFVRTIYRYFGSNEFSYEEILNALSLHPEWIEINHNIQQKQISYLGEKAKGSIPTKKD